MAIARSITETWRETDDDGTTFILGPIRQATIDCRVLGLISSGEPEDIGEAMALVLEGGGLRGWEGLKDAEGNEVPYTGNPRVDLSRLDPNDIMLLGMKVWKRANLTEAQRD